MLSRLGLVFLWTKLKVSFIELTKWMGHTCIGKCMTQHDLHNFKVDLMLVLFLSLFHVAPKPCYSWRNRPVTLLELAVF